MYFNTAWHIVTNGLCEGSNSTNDSKQCSINFGISEYVLNGFVIFVDPEGREWLGQRLQHTIL